MAIKVVYKNQCTPQEQVDFTGGGSRWYLDSDCGKKLSGSAELSLTTVDTFTDEVAVTTSPVTVANGSQDFVFIKNLGGGSGNDLHITIDNTNYLMVLSSGETFASKVHTAAVILVKCLSGDTTAQFLEGT